MSLATRYSHTLRLLLNTCQIKTLSKIFIRHSLPDINLVDFNIRPVV